MVFDLLSMPDVVMIRNLWSVTVELVVILSTTGVIVESQCRLYNPARNAEGDRHWPYVVR